MERNATARGVAPTVEPEKSKVFIATPYDHRNQCIGVHLPTKCTNWKKVNIPCISPYGIVVFWYFWRCRECQHKKMIHWQFDWVLHVLLWVVVKCLKTILLMVSRPRCNHTRRFPSSSIFKTPLTKQRLWVAHLTAEQVSSIASTIWQGQVCSLLAKRPDDFRKTTERIIASFDYRKSGLLCSQKSLTKVLYGF